MILLTWLAAFWCGSDFERLGCADWRERERAEYRIRLRWVFAVPGLFEAARSDVPEARHRAAVLLSPWRSAAADVRAAAVLLDPWPVNPWAFYADADLRHRLERIGLRYGFMDCDGGEWEVNPWWLADGAPMDAVAALELIRRRAGNTGPGWPFR